MPTENNERYDIAFAGECLEGHDPMAVRKAIGALFKADEATVERLFSGTRQRIKRDCDKSTALKYQKSLAAAGAKAIVTRASVSDPMVSAPAVAAPITTDTGQTETGELELLPDGSDVLRPDERSKHEEVALDLSHLTLAETGDRLSEKATGVGPVINAPDFDVAEPGAQIGEDNEFVPPPPPDTSALNLAPVGENLSDIASAEALTASVNIDHLDIAEAGSDLLKADERKISTAEAPDTSHLTLTPSENEPKT
ncbi:MAG: hypothetical protein ACI8RN_002655 [Glaciecola sp.]|jgi:hypothetical protein